MMILKFGISMFVRFVRFMSSVLWLVLWLVFSVAAHGGEKEKYNTPPFRGGVYFFAASREKIYVVFIFSPPPIGHAKIRHSLKL